MNVDAKVDCRECLLFILRKHFLLRRNIDLIFFQIKKAKKLVTQERYLVRCRKIDSIRHFHRSPEVHAQIVYSPWREQKRRARIETKRSTWSKYSFEVQYNYQSTDSLIWNEGILRKMRRKVLISAWGVFLPKLFDINPPNRSMKNISSRKSRNEIYTKSLYISDFAVKKSWRQLPESNSTLLHEIT